MVQREKEELRKIGMEVVESAANTFTAKKIELPNTRGNNVFDVDLVEVQLPQKTPAAADDWGHYKVQLQKSTGNVPTAMLDLDESKLLYQADVQVASGTEAADITMVDRQEIGSNQIGHAEYVANDHVYFCIQGTALAGAVTLQGRVRGSVETLSQKELTTLLLNELGA